MWYNRYQKRGSVMNNKLNNMLNDFFKENEGKSDSELNEKLEEFLNKYNSGEIKYENTPLDNAYELLEKAENSKSEKQAKKYAKEAYDMCPDCFDALLFLVNLEDDCLKRDKMLDDGLNLEKSRLEKEGYFEKENIGSFYGMFETRPYIRGLYAKAMNLSNDGKMHQACDVCNEILRLNKNDNLGVRYLLMAIYAVLENEKDMLKFYKKSQEESFHMLFPLFVLYYKLGNDEKANEYLERVKKANSNFVKFFKGTIKFNENVPFGCYSIGDSSEVLMYFDNYLFLMMSVPGIGDYVLKNSKKTKNN